MVQTRSDNIIATRESLLNLTLNLMKAITNKVHISELLKFIPHPVVVDCLTAKIPVVVQGVEGIATKRETLGKIIPKL